MNDENRTSGEAEVLEARYRRVLTLLPAGYREQRGEEMISTLLDGARDGRRWPSLGEVASVASLATRLHTGAPGGTRRAVAVGEVLRRAALAGLVALGLWHAAAAVTDLVAMASEHSIYLHYLSRPVLAWDLTMDFGQPLIYFGAFTALVFARRRLGRCLAVAQLVLVATALTVGEHTVASDQAALLAVALVIAIAAGSGFHREAPQLTAPGRWLAVVAGLTVLVLIVFGSAETAELGSQFRTSDADLADRIAHLAAGPVFPALAAGFGVVRARTSPIWPAALLTVGLPGLLLMPREAIILAQGKSGHLFYGDMFAGLPWPGMAIDMLIADVVLAVALGWALYRRRARSNAVAA